MSESVGACDDVVVRFNVTNAGNFTSDEVAQLYASGPSVDKAAPRIRLADFVRLRDVEPVTHLRRQRPAASPLDTAVRSH